MAINAFAGGEFCENKPWKTAHIASVNFSEMIEFF
jgi:hypothetical protein